MEEKIMNEEIMEVTEDLVPSGGSGIGGKLVGGAIIAGLAFAGYKLVKKLRAKKEAQYVEVEAPEDDVIDAEVVKELNKKLN